MGVRIEKAKSDVTDYVKKVMNMKHQGLRDAEVLVDVEMVWPNKNADGESTGPALSKGGYSCHATIQATTYEMRQMYGAGDLLIKIDAENWDMLSDRQREGLIHHELTHAALKTKEDAKSQKMLVCRHEHDNRPLFKFRKHDFQVGWFLEVGDEFQDDSIEVEQFKQIHAKCQGWLRFEREDEDYEEPPTVRMPRRAVAAQ